MTATARRDEIQRHISGPSAPSAIEAEKALIGIVLADPAALDMVDGLLPPHFYEPLHGRLWATIQDRQARGSAADATLLDGHFLTDEAYRQAGGLVWLYGLVELAPGASKAEAYAAEIKEAAQRRELLTLSDRIASEVREGEDSAADVIGHAEAALLAMQVSSKRLEPVAAAFAAGRVLDMLDAPPELVVGIHTGLEPLDEELGPLLAGDLVLLAARPSMGKSAASECIGLNISEQGYGVLQLNGEMSPEQMAQRHLADICHRIWGAQGPEYRDIRRRRITPEQRRMLGEAKAILDPLPLVMLKRSGLRLSQLRSVARRQAAVWARQNIRFGALIVDHMGLVKPDERIRDRYEAQTIISAASKELAEELDCPFIALNQMNRENERRDDKRPQLSDLRDSGCLAAGTRVYLPDTGEWPPIESLVGSTPTIAGAYEREVVAMPSVRVFPSGRKEVFRLTTMGGRQITATACHKFLTKEGWRRVDELSAGTLLAAPGRLPVHGRTGAMRTDEAALLGHLIGDGCVLPRHAVQYTTKDRDMGELVVALAKGVFGDAVTPRMVAEQNRKTHASWFQVYLTSAGRLTHGRRNPVTAWFDAMGIDGLRSHEKRVPEILYRQSPEVVAAFLRHLWATDGTVVNRARPTRGRGAHLSRPPPRNILTISFATSSRKLAIGVRDLLLSLGINSRVGDYAQGTKGRRQYPVTVAGLTAQRRFVERIGVAGSRKTAKVEAAAALLATCGDCQTYDGDIVWDSVREIAPAGAADVFDISVPTIHNFVADGLVVHNSWEQDADYVIGFYREAYYAQRQPEPVVDPKASAAKQADQDQAWKDWDRARRSKTVEAIILKARAGACSTIKLWGDVARNAIRGSAPQGGLM